MEDRYWPVADTLERWYYTLWGCRRGDHAMKMSGCMYCGAGGNGQPKYNVTFR